MKIDFAPQTKQGRRSAILIGVSVALIAFSGILSVSMRQLFGDAFFDNPLRAAFVGVTGLLGIAAGVLAFIFGIISIIKHKERSVLVILSSIMGLYALILILGEFLFPH